MPASSVSANTGLVRRSKDGDYNPSLDHLVRNGKQPWREA
jgi:hypothetical protein